MCVEFVVVDEFEFVCCYYCCEIVSDVLYWCMLLFCDVGDEFGVEVMVGWEVVLCDFGLVEFFFV